MWYGQINCKIMTYVLLVYDIYMANKNVKRSFDKIVVIF